MSFTDPGTQERARDALGSAGVDPGQRLTPVFSYANDIWIGEDVVVRCNRGRFPGAFAHEAAVLRLLPPTIPHAELITVGDDAAGEWMVLARVPGRTWTHTWPTLDQEGRRRLTAQLAQVMLAIGAVPVSADFSPAWFTAALADDRTLHEAHHPPVEAIPRLLARLRLLPEIDSSLVDALEDRFRLLWSACRPDDALVLVHADLHWDNLMVEGGRLVAVLDWEGARRARAELELDTPLRFSTWPWLPVSHADEALCQPDDYRPIPAWLRAEAPELFDHEFLVERLELHALAHDLVEGLHFAPGRDPDERPGTVWPRLRALAGGTSHIPALVNVAGPN